MNISSYNYSSFAPEKQPRRRLLFALFDSSSAKFGEIFIVYSEKRDQNQSLNDLGEVSGDRELNWMDYHTIDGRNDDRQCVVQEDIGFSKISDEKALFLRQATGQQTFFWGKYRGD